MVKKNKISPASVFFLLIVSKFSLVTVIKQRGEQLAFDGDFLLAAFVSIPVLLFAFMPLFFCIKAKRNPLKIKWVSVLYSAYYLLYAGITVYRFSSFCSEILTNYSKGIIFSLLITAGAVYCAYLGIDGISRFSGFAFAIFTVGVLFLFSMNINQAELFRLYPLEFKASTVFDDVTYICSGFAELALLPIIAEKVNGNSTKPYLFFIVLSPVMLFFTAFLALCVEGRGVEFCEYPVFTLFQTAQISGFERLDAIFTSVSAFGIFLRAALLVYCAKSALTMQKKGLELALCGGVTLAFALLCKYAGFVYDGKGLFQSALFLLFTVIIPLITLAFGRKSEGEKE